MVRHLQIMIFIHLKINDSIYTWFNFLFYAGIPKFVLISVHDYNIPSFLLTSGYFTGKRKAEAEVLSKYPGSGNSYNLFTFTLFNDLG